VSDQYVLKQPEFDWSGEADATPGATISTEEVTLTGPSWVTHWRFGWSAFAEHQDGYFKTCIRARSLAH